MPRASQARESVTELEAAVLAAIWRHGPCTAYFVRKTFIESPSPKWSGSAGAIYPILERLENKELVQAEHSNRGQRKQKDYVLTTKGRATLRRWLRDFSPELDAGLVHDPLRTKLLFLDLLTDAQAKRLVAQALEAIREHAKRLQQECDEHPLEESLPEHFAARNAVLITKARIDWLEEVQAALEQG